MKEPGTKGSSLDSSVLLMRSHYNRAAKINFPLESPVVHRVRPKPSTI